MLFGKGPVRRCLLPRLLLQRVGVISYEKKDGKSWRSNINRSGTSEGGGCSITKEGTDFGAKTKIETLSVTILVTVSGDYTLSFRPVPGNIFSMRGSNGLV